MNGHWELGKVKMSTNPSTRAPPALPGPVPSLTPVLRSVPDVDIDIAHQDAFQACNPDVDHPFASLEDACNRLLPFHVLADYEADDVNEKFLDSNGRVLSRSQLWNESLMAKINEFKLTFEKQIETLNDLVKKREDGEMRAEEDLMLELCLLQDEKRRTLELKAEMEREKAEREAVERARAEQMRMQEAAWQQSRRLVPGVTVLGDPFAFAGGLQLLEDERFTHEHNSLGQDGTVDIMLNGEDEDTNESVNMLAHNGPKASALDLNALSSMR
ncbi:hypothetical protein KP509_03G014100 [Ceratopteris richardii]|uniref:GLTSCR protein conserved domain-containing protein n=1 Tax=Ceratopteris richardii TaxID=49495 RepID=A0A8T2V0A4_CERRI|nr:hypothetical protein KP509_03G014100 [Ceratopteris richardii]